jgi:hypothetical protein
MIKNNENVTSFTMQKEIIYYLITDAIGSVSEQIAYPIKIVFVLNPDKKSSSETMHREHKISPHFVIHARTPKGINGKILKLLPNTPEDKEKAFFIDHNLSLSSSDRLALYHLLLQNYKHVYLLSSMIEEQNDFADFIEIFPDERAIMLFEQAPECIFQENN